MKKLFYLPLAIMLFAACSNDGDIPSAIQEENVSALYSFDDNGQIIVPATDVQNHTMQDFEEKVCGSYWSVVDQHQILADGTVSKESYSPIFPVEGGWHDYTFCIGKDSSVVYVSDDSLPIMRAFLNGLTSYDEKTGEVRINGRKLLTIISINSDNTITAINWSQFPNIYGDYVQETLQPLTKAQGQRIKENSDSLIAEYNRYIEMIEQDDSLYARFKRILDMLDSMRNK